MEELKLQPELKLKAMKLVGQELKLQVLREVRVQLGQVQAILIQAQELQTGEPTALEHLADEQLL